MDSSLKTSTSAEMYNDQSWHAELIISLIIIKNYDDGKILQWEMLRSPTQWRQIRKIGSNRGGTFSSIAVENMPMVKRPSSGPPKAGMMVRAVDNTPPSDPARKAKPMQTAPKKSAMPFGTAVNRESSFSLKNNGWAASNLSYSNWDLSFSTCPHLGIDWLLHHEQSDTFCSRLLSDVWNRKFTHEQEVLHDDRRKWIKRGADCAQRPLV